MNTAAAIHEALLKSIVEPMGTTIPVLTEAFHLLSPGSVGAANLIHFIADGGLALWCLDPETTDRASVSPH